MRADFKRGSIRRRRDGGLAAKNLSGSIGFFYHRSPNGKYSAMECAERFAASVTTYDMRTGVRFLYNDAVRQDAGFERALRLTRAGFRPQTAACI